MFDRDAAVAFQAGDPILDNNPRPPTCRPPQFGAELDPDASHMPWAWSLDGCQPDFQVWMNPYRREARVNLPQRALALDRTTSRWCVSLGQSAGGDRLTSAIPIADAIRLSDSPLTSEGDVLSLAGAIGDAARNVRVRATVAAFDGTPLADRYAEPPGLFFERGPLRGTLELALRVVAATSDFFDSSPMDKMTACSWSGHWVREVLGASLGRHAGNGSGSWSSSRRPLKILVHYPTITIPGVEGGTPSPIPGEPEREDSPNAAEGCPGSLVWLHLHHDGSANVSTDNFTADDGINTFVARTINSETIYFCNWSRVAEKAVMADYYFWLARLLQDWAIRSGPADKYNRYLARLAAKQGFAQVVAMAGDLVHEIGHLACDPSDHCCRGDGCKFGSGPARRNDCGTDLPRLLWWFWVSQTKNLPMPWPPTVRTNGSGAVGKSLPRDLAADLGLPQRTSTRFPSGPFSRSSYLHLGSTVGPQCGCEEYRVINERREHPQLELSPTLASGGSPKARCGYFFAFVREGQRTLLTYSFNPLCASSPEIHPTDSFIYWNNGAIQETSGGRSE